MTAVTAEVTDLALGPAWLAQVPTPLPTPPLFVDAALIFVLVWIGWWLWRLGSVARWGAALAWLLAAGGLVTVVAAVRAGL